MSGSWNEAYARSAARRASCPWMSCKRCGGNAQADGDGNTYCDNGVHHFRCDSCGSSWDSTRDWTPDDWDAFHTRRWRHFHGTEPSAEWLEWMRSKYARRASKT
jgi:hypothetical protein